MTDQDDKTMIEARLSQLGLTADRWDMAGANGVTAWFKNDWRHENPESLDLFEDDNIGKVYACVVGSERYNNQRVATFFVPESFDAEGGEEAEPFKDVVPL